MAQETSQQVINDIVWRACDTFRGTIDPAQYKDYILVMLFVKYLTDLRDDRRDEYEKKYDGDADRVARAMSRERFSLPPKSDFHHLVKHRNAVNLGELINVALTAIEDANKAKLDGVFRNIDFNSEANLGQTKERNARLQHLVDDFNDPRLDLRPSRIGDRDVIGDAYEFLIGRFAADSGKKGGEFYTPPQVAQVLAQLLAPAKGDRICDPCCGSGSLLIRASKQVGSDDYALFGQELNGGTWALCRMNMFLHGVDGARIERGDTLRTPRLVEDDRLMKFDVVIANPPFSLDKWGHEDAAHDRFARFHRGLPPRSKADYAFITHMIESSAAGHGRVGVVVPHGVLFRGQSEGKIRRQLIEENLLDGVVGLPSNLFFGTGIPAALVLFNRAKKNKGVFFIDASRDFEPGKNQNRLRPEDIERIVATWRARKDVDKYAKLASLEQIKENDFNLNIPLYVDTFEEEQAIDLDAVQKEIGRLEDELAKTRVELKAALKELGL
ncbi:MAG: type I restriction-modification system subunit M [Candidatus Eisenbacteria bacterium]